MNPFDHSEENIIQKLLEKTAQQIEPNSMFVVQLENQLKQNYTPKKGFNMPTLKNISSAIGWMVALTVLALAFNWIASQIAPKTVPASNVTETVTEESTPEPSIATSTPVPVIVSTEPFPISASTIFGDNFEGTLDEDWQWLREDNNNWNLTNNPGWLEIMAGFGLVNGGNINNLLLRPIPDGNFELETKLIFKPIEEMQFAGLIVFENAANHLQFGHAFCHAPACTGTGIYFENMFRGSWNIEDFEFKADNMEIVYLRLRREGNTFTAYASENGKEWKLIGAHTSEIKPMFVGLVAGQSFNRSVLAPAQFDYFVINALP